MSIELRLRPEKAIQAAALLLKLHGDKPMKYIGLLKMLYIADRMALEEIEQSITGDRAVSMKHGPVLSGVYDLIKGRLVVTQLSLPTAQSALQRWSRFIIKTEGNAVTLAADPGEDRLSEAAIDILQKVYQTFGHLDPFDIAAWTHDLPEWQDPADTHSAAMPIKVETILRNLGKSEKEITAIQEEIQREQYLDTTLNRLNYEDTVPESAIA